MKSQGSRAIAGMILTVGLSNGIDAAAQGLVDIDFTKAHEAVADYVTTNILNGNLGDRTLWMTQAPLDATHVARDIDPEVADLPFPPNFQTSWLVMIDDNPGANFGHAVRWMFVEGALAGYTDPVERDFPPRVFADSGSGEEVEFACVEAGTVACTTTEATIFEGQVLVEVEDTCQYAVLISGGAYASMNYSRYRENLTSMYGLLRGCGYSKNNIYVYYADGSSLDLDNADGDGSHTTGNDVTGAADESVIRARIQSLCTNLVPEEDVLFIYVSNHGSNDAGACLYDHDGSGSLEADELYSPNELAADTAGCSVCHLYMLHDQCYSGEFLAMASDGNHDNLAVYAAATASESSWGREYMAQWETNDVCNTPMNDLHADVVAHGGLTSTAGSAEGTTGIGNSFLGLCCCGDGVCGTGSASVLPVILLGLGYMKFSAGRIRRRSK